MKKLFSNRIFQFISILITGLLLGWILFGGSESQLHSEKVDEETIWTCSMHPQIRQNEPGKCPLCGMDLIPLTAGSSNGSDSPFIYTMSPEAVALANVQTTKAGYSAPEHEVYLTGKVAVNEQKLAVISANFSGRIEKLYIDFTGQSVTKGQKLASIYSPDLITAQRELIEASKNKHSNQTLYNAVKEKLRLWKLTEKQIESIEESGRILTEIDVFADASGIVLTRNISLGDYINKGSVLFEVADLTTLWILFDAYEQDISWIKTGNRINFTVASLPGKEFSSVVTFIDPLINPQTRTISVRAEASNAGMQLKPEMFVKGKIKAKFTGATELKGKSLLIPKSSVLWTGTRSVLYVKVPGTESPAFEMREIVLGPRAGDFYIVEQGLNEGEEVVTNGVFAVDAAAQLSGNYSMMNRPVSKRFSVPDEFKARLTAFTKSYFDLKNELANDNFTAAKKSIPGLIQNLKKIESSLLSGNAYQAWNTHSEKINKAIDKISKSKNINDLRIDFEPLSDALIESTELFGLNINIVYVQFCPMAFDDKGAYWLSESDQILNPYFGDEMLNCGEVTKKISSVDSYRNGSDNSSDKGNHVH